MSESNHSPGPWREYRKGEEGAGTIYDAGDFIVARTTPRSFPGDSQRIVACVNACDELPTMALEQGSLRKALTAADALLFTAWPETEEWYARADILKRVEDLRTALRVLGIGRLP